MCPTKMLLKSSVDSNNPYISLVCCSKYCSKNRDVFPKFAVFMDPLGVIVQSKSARNHFLASLSKK